MADTRRIRPNALTTRYSRYAMGGNTEINGDMLGVWEPVSTDALESYATVPHTIEPHEAGRIDLISQRYYGTPSLGWLILQHNKIIDDIEEIVEGAELRIPDPERVRTGITSLKSSDTVRAI